MSKAQYAEQGNQRCERIEERVTQAASSRFSQQGEIPSADQITDFVNETLAPAIEDELDALRELNPPEQDEERVDDILTAGQRGVEGIRRDPTSVIGERNPLDDYDELADGYGLDKCGAISDEVERALAGLGSGGPVRGGDGTEGTGDTGGTEGTGDTGDTGEDGTTTETTG